MKKYNTINFIPRVENHIKEKALMIVSSYVNFICK